jgi:hypothetical protein
MISLIESWDRNKVWIYFAVFFVLLLSLILGLVICNSPLNQPYASIGAMIVIVIALIFIGLIELDLITDALGIANTPRRMREKLLATYPDIKRSRKEGKSWHSSRLRKAYIEDYYHEIESWWWRYKSYTPIMRIVIIFGKIMMVILFFSCISMCLAYLLNFKSFEGLTRESNLFEHFYLASQAVFLIGYDNVHPLHDGARIISIIEFLVGFLSLAIGVDRLVEPPDEDLRRLRQALDMYFQ